ncbi:cardiolipin synthase [Companilactobacillus metriopterae]|uniref:cardiolipin synthase n=1 Tax=Companilactobacillus metriopterae TaxID=1909267 RepID=UPI00100B1CCE|nr:cardiolipin synthase [Companilactobacillus metriopterae]
MISLWIIGIIVALLIINTVVALITVFIKPRSTVTVWAWILVLVLLPGVGFILYAFFGRGIAREKLFNFTSQEYLGVQQVKKMAVTDQNSIQLNSATDQTKYASSVVNFFNKTETTPITHHNEVELIFDGKEKFKKMFADIRAAKETVHVEYYAFIDSDIGDQLLSLLVDKANEGLEVRVLYDPWGSTHTKPSYFNPLKEAGGEVVQFITAKNSISKTRLNYHLHRKNVIIDGYIGYIGGFNVGDEYLGKSPKFGYWRDSHARISGTAVLLLQERFFMDWNASLSRRDEKLPFSEKYFPRDRSNKNANIPIQIVADGPDNNEEILKDGFIDMIMKAKESVWLQTPYLTPDDAVFTALTIAARSGIDVRIMIPCMPDHAFIYRATQYYANLLIRYGVKVYTYENGFLHAKTSVIDGKYGSVGSMNHDYRSYQLNFEMNAFFYDTNVAQQIKNSFLNDLEVSHELTQEIVDQQSPWLKFKQRFSRLLAPIL